MTNCDCKRIRQESLQVGDILHLRWCSDKHIVGFEEYKGAFDFVSRIAVLSDGGEMSLTKGYYYEVLAKAKEINDNYVRGRENDKL